jgi:hypothetical protein
VILMNDNNQDNTNQNQAPVVDAPASSAPTTMDETPMGNSNAGGMPNLNDMPNPVAPMGQGQDQTAVDTPAVPSAPTGTAEPMQPQDSPMGGEQTTDGTVGGNDTNQGGQQ